jgi:hypothetical protein
LNGTIRRFVGHERPQAAKCGVNLNRFRSRPREFSGFPVGGKLVLRRCDHVLRSYVRAIIF